MGGARLVSESGVLFGLRMLLQLAAPDAHPGVTISSQTRYRTGHMDRRMAASITPLDIPITNVTKQTNEGTSIV